MELGLSGRTAAVAASGAGLGFACAAALVAEGVQVAVAARDQRHIEDAARRLGERAVPVVADVSTAAGAAGFVDAARSSLGHVDILVANAGGPTPGGFTDVGLDAYRAALDLSLLSTVVMCQEAVPAMCERGWGRVVAITSIGVRRPIADLILSNTARSGLTAFLHTLAAEVAPSGVTVNSVQPGSHDTQRLRSIYGGTIDAAAAENPTGRIGDPADLGALVAFLCSAQAWFVTGVDVPVDGGQSIAF